MSNIMRRRPTAPPARRRTYDNPVASVALIEQKPKRAKTEKPKGGYRSAKEMGYVPPKAISPTPKAISPTPKAIISRITDVGPAPMPGLPTVRTTIEMRTSREDRAKAFQIEILSLAVVSGLLAVVVAVAGRNAPIVSLAVLGWFLGGFATTWLAGYLLHTFVSPDGNNLLTALLHYRLLRFEQREREARYQREGE